MKRRATASSSSTRLWSPTAALRWRIASTSRSTSRASRRRRKPSYSAKAEYPVRRGLTDLTTVLWITGSPGQAARCLPCGGPAVPRYSSRYPLDTPDKTRFIVQETRDYQRFYPLNPTANNLHYPVTPGIAKLWISPGVRELVGPWHYRSGTSRRI